MRSPTISAFFISVALMTQATIAMDYPYQTDEPQKSGWPLRDDELAYVLRPEHDRRPGREAKKHLARDVASGALCWKLGRNKLA